MVSFTLNRDNFRLKRATDTVREAVAKAMYRRASLVMADSQEHYVPVDTGYLRSTGFVNQPVIVDGTVEVTLGYSALYAEVVHEDLTAVHPNGQAKFLARPLNAAKKGFAGEMAEAARAAQ